MLGYEAFTVDDPVAKGLLETFRSVELVTSPLSPVKAWGAQRTRGKRNELEKRPSQEKL